MDRYINLRVIASLDRLRCKRIIWLGESLLHSPSWDILFCLYKYRTGASSVKITEDIVISQGVLARWLAILEQRDFVVRDVKHGNYHLTATGAEAVVDVLSVAYGSEEQVLAS